MHQLFQHTASTSVHFPHCCSHPTRCCPSPPPLWDSYWRLASVSVSFGHSFCNVLIILKSWLPLLKLNFSHFKILSQNFFLPSLLLPPLSISVSLYLNQLCSGPTPSLVLGGCSWCSSRNHTVQGSNLGLRHAELLTQLLSYLHSSRHFFLLWKNIKGNTQTWRKNWNPQCSYALERTPANTFVCVCFSLSVCMCLHAVCTV